jgi:hypothetical protein
MNGTMRLLVTIFVAIRAALWAYVLLDYVRIVHVSGKMQRGLFPDSLFRNPFVMTNVKPRVQSSKWPHFAVMGDALNETCADLDYQVYGTRKRAHHRPSVYPFLVFFLHSFRTLCFASSDNVNTPLVVVSI